jgi:hypothetical protein
MFQKELYNGIPNVAVWRVLNTLNDGYFVRLKE